MKKKCKGKTKTGRQCRNTAKKTGDFCHIHAHSRPTAAQVQIRIMTVLEMLTKGKSRDFILRHTATNWKISERQTDEYIKKASFQIKETLADKREDEINLALLQFNDLYDKSYQIQDYRECRLILESKLKFLSTTDLAKKSGKMPENVKQISKRKNF